MQPHELAILQDVLLLTPYGFCRAGKFRLHDGEMRPLLLADSKIVRAKVIAVVSAETGEIQELPDEIHQSTEVKHYAQKHPYTGKYNGIRIQVQEYH